MKLPSSLQNVRFCRSDGQGDSWRPLKFKDIALTVCGKVATGEGSETVSHFPDYYEAAATKSLGRALEGLGFGTPFALENSSPAEPDPSPASQPSQSPRVKVQRH